MNIKDYKVISLQRKDYNSSFESQIEDKLKRYIDVGWEPQSIAYAGGSLMGVIILLSRSKVLAVME